MKPTNRIMMAEFPGSVNYFADCINTAWAIGLRSPISGMSKGDNSVQALALLRGLSKKTGGQAL
ncbi:Uu.00g112670.m01.CDS01 [Anthostomella pinea]|uniref:Uu.00g112670.m01.CDS01 n=1 Tax=Anthostomella pinea TaxID=933095 RepID=A0AAI8VFC8_9PEZI|nr:Uu.00g112670.m01.CDS01 [Anthostomella pinea]